MKWQVTDLMSAVSLDVTIDGRNSHWWFARGTHSYLQVVKKIAKKGRIIKVFTVILCAAVNQASGNTEIYSKGMPRSVRSETGWLILSLLRARCLLSLPELTKCARRPLLTPHFVSTQHCSGFTPPYTPPKSASPQAWAEQGPKVGHVPLSASLRT